MSIQNILNYQLFGNSGQQWLLALGTLILLLVVFKVFSSIVISKLTKAAQKTETDLDNFFISLIKNVKPPFYFLIAIYAAAQTVQLNELADKVVFGAFLAVVVYQTITILQRVIDYGIQKTLMGADEKVDQDKAAIVKLIGQLIKFALWIVGVLLLLGNFGINVTSLVAGLGIGGIAIALALQNILGDMFASFSIFVDKPFKVGDFISISPKEIGTVEKIGIKSTRIRTLQGQQLVVSNKKLTDSSVDNFRRMEKRRIVFGFGIAYETPVEKVKEIPTMIAKISEKIENIKLSRVHFKEFGDFSLNFEVVYVVQSASYDEYMDVQQIMNLAIMENFEKEAIQFAYPTQTIFVKK